MKVTITSPALAPTIARWQAKKGMLHGVGALGAAQIAEAANTKLLAQAFPGRIPRTVHMEVGPSGGAMLGNAIGVVDKPLFWWYTKGTATWAGRGYYDIYPVRAKALAFFWRKIGEHVVFAHVSNPGTRPHEFELDAFLALLMAEAEATWRTLLAELLHS